MQTIKLKRGLDIPFEGQAAETLGSVYPRRVCISLSAWRNPPPPHSAPLYKTLTNPNSIYPARHQNLWSLFSNGGFQCGVLRTSVSIYGGFLIRCSVSSRTCIVLVFYLYCFT